MILGTQVEAYGMSQADFEDWQRDSETPGYWYDAIDPDAIIIPAEPSAQEVHRSLYRRGWDATVERYGIDATMSAADASNASSAAWDADSDVRDVVRRHQHALDIASTFEALGIDVRY